VDLLGGLHHLKSPQNKRFVQDQALNSPMASVYAKPLATSEIKKKAKTKLIQVHKLKSYHAYIGDVISHKILWEPESEPNLNETQANIQKPEWGETVACGVPT
jgi:hypothetical protein